MNMSQELPSKIMALLEDYGDVGEEYERGAVNPYLQSLRGTQFGMQEAAQARDRLESKFHRYADPITAGLAGLAFILDKTSGKQMRRMTAGPKLTDITGGIRERRAERGVKRQQKYGQRLKEIEMEHGLAGARFGAKTGLAEMKERGISRKITGAKVAASLGPKAPGELGYKDKRDKRNREIRDSFFALPEIRDLSFVEKMRAFRETCPVVFGDLDGYKYDLTTGEEKFRDKRIEIKAEISKRYAKLRADAVVEGNADEVERIDNIVELETNDALREYFPEVVAALEKKAMLEKGDIPTSAPFDMSKFLQATAEGSPVLLDIFSKTYGSDTEKFISEPPSVGRSDTQGRVYNPYLYGR